MVRTWYLIILLFTAPQAVLPQSYFEEVAEEIGLTGRHRQTSLCGAAVGSPAAAWADYDGDGDTDLYYVNHRGENWLYRNEGIGGNGLPVFSDVAAAAGVEDPDGIGLSAVFIDYDNDGDQDLYLTNYGGNILFQNQLIPSGIAAFIDATDFAGIRDGGRAITTGWADFDKDGYLDVYLAKHYLCPTDPQSQDVLFKNNGDGTFSDVSGWLCPGGTAPCPSLGGLGFTAGWVDYDNDADLDLYLVNDNIAGANYPNVLWRNDGYDGNGGWVFTDVSVESGAGISCNGMGLGIADYDNDGWFDLSFSNIGPNYLLRNNGNGTFEDVSETAGIKRELLPGGEESVTWGTVFFDYNNDMFTDLFIAAGNIGNRPEIHQSNAFFQSNGDGTFTDISFVSALDDSGRARAAGIVDLDEDGFVDLIVGNLVETPLMYHNKSAELGNSNHWLTVTAEGTISNRDGIGTRMYLTTPDGVTQMREINSGPTYGGGDYRAAFFGMGANTEGDLTVRWPTGITENLGTVAADQKLHLVESDGSSEYELRVNCGRPTYVAWNGDVFLGDRPYVPGVFGYTDGRQKVYSRAWIAGTQDDPLYQSMRYLTGTFSYLFDEVPHGVYEIKLHFMEPTVNGPNGRLFDVFAEDQLVLDDYDIYTAAGGSTFAAAVATVSVPVTDGQLKIDFVSSPDRHALVCAIEVLSTSSYRPLISPIPDQSVFTGEPFSPIYLDTHVFDVDDPDSVQSWSASGGSTLSVQIGPDRVAIISVSDSAWIGSETIYFTAEDPTGLFATDSVTFTVSAIPPYEARINAGGPLYTTISGQTFEADRPFSPGDFGYIGGTATLFPNPVDSTEDDHLYQAARFESGVFSYQFDGLPSATYEIILYLSEPSVGGIGGRLMDVVIEDSLVLDDFDIFEQAGGMNIAHQETLFTPVVDGLLTIEFISANPKQALVGAISVVEQTAADRMTRSIRQDESLLSSEDGLPAEFGVSQNYPNPFNPSTSINYALKHDTWVTVKIYNALGQEILTLVDEYQTAGYRTARWDGINRSGSKIASGLYFYRMTAGNFIGTRKMILTK